MPLQFRFKHPFQTLPTAIGEHTDERQPDKLEFDQCDNAQGNPQKWLRIDGQPEEPAIGGIDLLNRRVARFEDPMRVTTLGIDLVPPSQTNEPSTGNIFEVIEINSKENDSDDEDHNTKTPDQPKQPSLVHKTNHKITQMGFQQLTSY